MGYTHYWTQKRGFTNLEWQDVVKDLAAIVTTAIAEGVAIADTHGETRMVGIQIDRDGSGRWAGFNGFKDESHESFLIEQKRGGWNFCKTARKAYDVAVTACLIYLESYHPERFSVSSDGTPDDWQAGLALARRALPRLDNVLRIPADVMFESLFSRFHVSGGRLTLASLRDSTPCIIDREARQILGRFKSEEAGEWLRGWIARTQAERQAKLPARVDVLERWQARKLRAMVQAAESFGYLEPERAAPEMVAG